MTIRSQGLDWFSKNLIEILPAAVYVCDADAVIVAFNRRATELWGRAPRAGQTDEKFCGSHKLFRPDGAHLPHHETPMAHVLRTGKPASDQEAIIERPDGSRVTVLVNIAPIFNDTGQQIGAVNCFQDLSAQKNSEAERAQLREDLQQSRKMEAVGQLTGGLAHDFNNLLAAVSGSLELLQLRIKQGKFSGLERYIAIGQGAIVRATTLTHRLLAFARRQPLEARPTDINALVGGMTELIRGAMGPGVVVDIVSEDALWTTLVDRNQLENALLNLCINARDAMPEGGQLTIATANARFDERQALERAMPSGQYVSLSVRDTGTGMTPEVAARMFEPFYTTKAAGSGTGLGLSTIYGFVRQSGGHVHVESEPIKGTTVSLFFQREAGTAEAAENAMIIEAAQRAHSGTTVLVIDDEALLRTVMIEAMQELGYITMEAGDAAAGLLILRSDARIDLLITDIGLPGGMNGRQLADAAREHRPNLKVLFVTGYAGNESLEPANLPSGMAAMMKPFTFENLGRRVHEIIAAS
jgi:PAS domain S-box-containing protein